MSTDVIAILGKYEQERRANVRSIVPEMTVRLEGGPHTAAVLRLVMVLVEGETEERPIAVERIVRWCEAVAGDNGPRYRAPQCSHPETSTEKVGLGYTVTCVRCDKVIESSLATPPTLLERAGLSLPPVLDHLPPEE